MHPTTVYPGSLKERPRFTGFQVGEQVTDKFIFNPGVFPNTQTLPDLFPAQETAPFLPDELSVGDQDRPAFRRQHFEQSSHQQNAGCGAAVPLVREDFPHQRDHGAPEEGAQDKNIERGLTVMPGRAVHHQGEFTVGEQGKQDVTDVLRGELGVVKHPCHDASFGLQSRVSGQMESDLAMESGFGLEKCQEHFSQPLQSIHAAVRETGFQMDGQRVSLQSGGFGTRHRF